MCYFFYSFLKHVYSVFLAFNALIAPQRWVLSAPTKMGAPDTFRRGFTLTKFLFRGYYSHEVNLQNVRRQQAHTSVVGFDCIGPSIRHPPIGPHISCGLRSRGPRYRSTQTKPKRYAIFPEFFPCHSWLPHATPHTPRRRGREKGGKGARARRAPHRRRRIPTGSDQGPPPPPTPPPPTRRRRWRPRSGSRTPPRALAAAERGAAPAGCRRWWSSSSSSSSRRRSSSSRAAAATSTSRPVRLASLSRPLLLEKPLPMPWISYEAPSILKFGSRCT